MAQYDNDTLLEAYKARVGVLHTTRRTIIISRIVGCMHAAAAHAHRCSSRLPAAGDRKRKHACELDPVDLMARRRSIGGIACMQQAASQRTPIDAAHPLYCISRSRCVLLYL